MKRKLLLFAWLLTGIVSAYADGLVGVTNAINFVPKCRASFDIMLQNNPGGMQFKAWQAYIQLPEGLTYASYEPGDINDATHTTGTSVTVSSDNKITITVLSTDNKVLTAATGRLMRIFLNVDASVAIDAVKTLAFTGVELTQVEGTTSTAQAVSDFNFNVTISNDVTLDEYVTFMPADVEGVDVTLKRNLKAGMWNTIVLPMAMSSAQITSAFGAGTKVAEFTGADFEYMTTPPFSVTGLKVNFAEVTDGMAAHKPYIIKVPSAVSEATISNHAISALPSGLDVPKITFYAYSSTNCPLSFVGTYESPTVIPADGLFLSDNKFVYSAGSSKLRAFRGYFDFYTSLPDKTAASRAITFSIDGESTTGIFNMEEGTLEKSGRYYNLQGQRVAKPRKGVYIVDGKQVIIK